MLQRVSVDSSGKQLEGESVGPTVSGDGSMVAFSHYIPGAYNSWNMVRDLRSGETRTLFGPGETATLTTDGRYLAFNSKSSHGLIDQNGSIQDVLALNLATGVFRFVSVASSGQQGNADSGFGRPAVSANGRFAAFESQATNLVAGDTNGCSDVFVHDRTTGQTTRVSVRSDEHQGNAWSGRPSVSADGRFVAFASLASNLVPGDGNGRQDVFLHDRAGGVTSMVSSPLAHDFWPLITGNGRYVVFDHYVWDRQLQVLTLGPNSGFVDSVSADGRFIVFRDQPRNNIDDVFVLDRVTGGSACVSVSDWGDRADGPSGGYISADGRYIAMWSKASNLVPDDSNGFGDVFLSANPLLPLPPTLAWLGESGYITGGVAPDSGVPDSTVFRFKVKLLDPNGDEPGDVLLTLQKDGSFWRTLKLRPGTEPTRAGRTYSAATRLPVGNYDYQFAATDKDGTATGPPTEFHTGPVMDAPPFLTFAPKSGYETDGVKPNSGTAGITAFKFKVVYHAYDGDSPRYVRVRLWRSSAAYGSVAMKPANSAVSPIQGAVYAVTRTLPAGAFEYRFEASDKDGAAGGPASVRMPGPKVRDASLVTVMGLSALPTGNGGAQITFTLSTPASVSVQVLNMAGRTVGAIASRGGLGTGAHALLWSGRTTAGLPAPKGAYLVKVEAKAADGSTASSVVPYHLLR